MRTWQHAKLIVVRPSYPPTALSAPLAGHHQRHLLQPKLHTAVVCVTAHERLPRRLDRSLGLRAAPLLRYRDDLHVLHAGLFGAEAQPAHALPLDCAARLHQRHRVEHRADRVVRRQCPPLAQHRIPAHRGWTRRCRRNLGRRRLRRDHWQAQPSAAWRRFCVCRMLGGADLAQ